MSSYRFAACGLITLLLAPAAQAAGKDAPFALIQSQCVRSGEVSAAALRRSPNCRVTKGRWFSTIELTDFYQAQYCLHERKDAPDCTRRALLLFANRAYTPTARLTLERIDPPGTEYEDPQVLATAYGYVLKLQVRRPKAAPETSYYRWQDDRWHAIDTDSWRQTITRLLPAGSRIGQPAPPDLEAMQSRVAVFRPGDGACCPGAEAEIDFELAGDRLSIKALRTNTP